MIAVGGEAVKLSLASSTVISATNTGGKPERAIMSARWVEWIPPGHAAALSVTKPLPRIMIDEPRNTHPRLTETVE